MLCNLSILLEVIWKSAGSRKYVKELFKNFKLHGGYGVTTKAPTLLHLYPNPAYFDLVNYNYYAPKPEERLIMVTTSVLDTQNNDLVVAKNIKQEIGFDYSLKNIELSVTAFQEKLKNGYSFYNQIVFIPVDIFEAREFPIGQPPILLQSRSLPKPSLRHTTDQ